MKTDIKLEKSLSPVKTLAMAFGCIIGWGAFVMPASTFLPKAGPLGTLIGMALAALIMIAVAFNYNYMIERYPSAGGEFIYTQKAFGRNHSFVCAWFLSLSYATLVPMNATALALIGRNLMGNLFQVGFHYTVAGYDVYLGEMLLAFAAILFFGFLSIRGVSFAGLFQVILTVMLIGGVLIIGAAALISPKAAFSNLSPAFNASGSKIGGVLAVLAVAPWAFVGFDTVPQAAEEFNFSPRKTKSIMIVSILFGAVVYVILNTVTAAVVPEGFASWADYIDAAGTLPGLESLPTFYAAYQLLGNVGLLIIGIAVLGAILSGIIGFYMASSRLLYSLAKEGVIPSWFGSIHSRTRAPYHAIIFLMMLSLIAPFFGRTALGWLVDMSSLGAAIGYAYTSAAAFKHAKAKGDKRIMTTGLVGTSAGIVFALLLLIPFPGLNCALGKESYICFIVWTVLGIAFYVSTGIKEDGKMEKTCKDIVLENNELVLYGCGEDGRKICRMLREMGKNPAFFCDTYSREPQVEGLAVLTPEELRNNHSDAMVIVASNRNKHEISKKLTEMGWQAGNMITEPERIFSQYNLYKQREYSEYTPEQRRKFVENIYQEVMHRPLDLDNPKTFCEKIQWVKLYGATPLLTRLTDKCLVRDYVREKVGGSTLSRCMEYMIPLMKLILINCRINLY